MLEVAVTADGVEDGRGVVVTSIEVGTFRLRLVSNFSCVTISNTLERKLNPYHLSPLVREWHSTITSCSMVEIQKPSDSKNHIVGEYHNHNISGLQ